MKQFPPADRFRKKGRFERNRGGNEHGIALFMVLWVLVLLTVVVSQFCYSMRTDVNITRNFKEKTASYYIALAGIHTAVSEIVSQNGLQARTEEAPTEDGGEGSPWCINADIPAMPYKGGSFKVWVDNESGKFDLNTVDRFTIIKILSGFQIDAYEMNVIAESILDWRDKDSLHRTNGAEDDYYQMLPEPYPCRDADFESVAELLRVRGVTQDLYGEGLGSVFTVYEKSGRDSASKTGAPKVKVVTAVRQKINLNAASRTMLMALPGMSEDLVSSIMDYRTGKDFQTAQDVIELLGAENYVNIAQLIDFKLTGYYTIHSIGRLEGSQVAHYMKVLIVLDPMSERKYRVIRWWDQATS